MSWKTFYEKRINSSYQEYFNKRYAFLINLIIGMGITSLKEEGVGIGSVMKALPLSIDCMGSDICDEMLDLCRRNNSHRQPVLWKEDIVTGESIDFFHEVDVQACISHGVIEHFDDETIKKIIDRQKSQFSTVIHYVPSDQYEIPSFGDERLLSKEYWLNLVNPTYLYEENEGKDLYLVFK